MDLRKATSEKEFNFKDGRILSLFVFRRQQLRIIKLSRKKDLIPALLISEDYPCDNFLMLKEIYRKNGLEKVIQLFI